jgi:IS605 OrfB family transposase
VNQLVSNNVKTLIIGKNNGQKQDINMGKVNNQNFTQLPLFKFLDTVAYKARLEGMNIIWQEESYTSKASFLNLDYIPKLNEGKIKFSGYRIKRGLYNSNNFIINADVNGSYNIMRKAIPNIFSDGIEGFAINPIKLKI